jgi:hypothetical protein
VTLASFTGFNVTDTPIDEVRYEAVIFAAVVIVTTLVVTLNVAEVAPALIVTVAGTVAELELLANLMGNPADGAAEEILTVPESVVPPKAEVGETSSPLTVGGFMVRFAEDELLPDVALIAATVLAATGIVAISKVAVVLPEGTVMDALTVADDFEEDKSTTKPAVPAALVMVTVPTALPPPTTLAGDKETLPTVCALDETAIQATIPVIKIGRTRGFKSILEKL